LVHIKSPPDQVARGGLKLIYVLRNSCQRVIEFVSPTRN